MNVIAFEDGLNTILVDWDALIQALDEETEGWLEILVEDVIPCACVECQSNKELAMVVNPPGFVD